MNPIYITDFSVDKDKFTFTVPEVVETIPYNSDQLGMIDNIEGIETLDSHKKGILFDDVFRMYLVENFHVTLVILVDKCHILSVNSDITLHPQSSGNSVMNTRSMFEITYECMMSRRGLIIWRG